VLEGKLFLFIGSREQYAVIAGPQSILAEEFVVMMMMM
jgi:hypothetical protein